MRQAAQHWSCCLRDNKHLPAICIAMQEEAKRKGKGQSGLTELVSLCQVALVLACLPATLLQPMHLHLLAHVAWQPGLQACVRTFACRRLACSPQGGPAAYQHCMQVPFVLTPSAKQQILRMEAKMQQAVIGQSYSDQARLLRCAGALQGAQIASCHSARPAA